MKVTETDKVIAIEVPIKTTRAAGEMTVGLVFKKPSATGDREIDAKQCEDLRRILTPAVNMVGKDLNRVELEAAHGQVWNTEELTKEFEVQGFQAPYVVVRRRSDNKVGSLMFLHNPRYYFNWVEDTR